MSEVPLYVFSFRHPANAGYSPEPETQNPQTYNPKPETLSP